MLKIPTRFLSLFALSVPFIVAFCMALLTCVLWMDSLSAFERSSKGMSPGGWNPDWYLKCREMFRIIHHLIYQIFSAHLSITLNESSFSLIDSDAFTIPSRQRAMIGATCASTFAEHRMNSLIPCVRFSSSS